MTISNDRLTAALSYCAKRSGNRSSMARFFRSRASMSPEELSRVREHRRKKALEDRYGITASHYEAMVTAQGGRCVLCGEAPSGKRPKLFVDHCHTTGKIRGLLCNHCNTGLGYFKDSEERLLKAIAYLKRNAP